MSYEQIVGIIFQVISATLTILTIHWIVFGILGVFHYKKFPHSEVKHKYGIIICARNEEAVITNLIESIHKNNYPQDLLHIFVMAHNCTDKTAEKAREAGATVYEYHNDSERTKGYALKKLFECIEKDFGIKNLDGYFVFDADNVLTENYIEKMNDAFEAQGCKDIITSFRNAKNFGHNIVSALYGIFFMFNCRLECRGRTILNCSTRVQGTGFLVNSEILKDGWPYLTLTEDWEFSADQILNGGKIVYCDEAELYDEQPVDLRVMMRQRLRWAKGHLLVCITRGKLLLKSIFGKRNCREGNSEQTSSNKFSQYDIFFNILPMTIVSSVVSLLNMILTMLSPIFGSDPVPFWKNFLISNVSTLIMGYIGMMVGALLILIVEHKRIKCNFWKKVGAVICYPLFVSINFVLDVVALFSKNIVWKEIPHKDTTTIEELSDQKKYKNDVDDDIIDTVKI